MAGVEITGSSYIALLAEIKAAVTSARIRAAHSVNHEMVALYWQVGRLILQRQEAEGWGTKVIDRLSIDLRTEFPGMRGFGTRSLVYMRTFAAAYPTSIAQEPLLGTRQKVSLTGEPSPNYDTGGMFSVPLAHAPTLRLWAFGDSESTPRRRGATTASLTTSISPTSWPRAGWRCGSWAERSRRTPARRTPLQLRCS